MLKIKKLVILAFDHAVEHGPHIYKGINLDPLRIAEIAEKGNADALIVHIGSGKIIRKKFPKLPIIVKLTARSSLTKLMIQEIVTSVEEAMSINPIGLAATVYVGSTYEHIMLKNLCEIKKECRSKKIPIFAFMYPRPKDKKSFLVKDVRYAARLGSEIGVDYVKTYYTGDKESFQKVVKDCFVPVLAAGGPKIEEKNFIKIVKNVIEAGAAGVVVGRNIWSSKDPINLLKTVVKIVKS